MTAVRAIFDGKAFIPQEQVSIPPQSEALVLVESADPSTHIINQEIREYYQSGTDSDDNAWAAATAEQSQRAWDED